VKFVKATKAYLEARRKEWAAEFPGAHFGGIFDINPAVLKAFRTALAERSEEAIQRILTANPYLIQYAMDNSGHHGIWSFPKQMIKPKGADQTPGLVPDYLVVTRSSLGYLWHIVELKRFDVQFARHDSRGLAEMGIQRSLNAMSICLTSMIISMPYGAISA
jgi:hypothetical protein